MDCLLRLDTAEVTGSIPVAPTTRNPYTVRFLSTLGCRINVTSRLNPTSTPHVNLNVCSATVMSSLSPSSLMDVPTRRGFVVGGFTLATGFVALRRSERQVSVLLDYGRRMRRLIVAVLVSGMAVSGCGGELSLTEYAIELETATAEMNARLDELDDEIAGSSDLGQVKRYASDRVVARNAFVDVLEGLDPPDDVSDLHDSALRIMGRLTDAESALADYVIGLDSAVDLDTVWLTPLGVAARSADEESIALCLAAQAELDSTEERIGLAEVPWIPQELKEVVTIAFGCIEEER